MKAPKGFGKRSFSLALIQAYSGTARLRGRMEAFALHHRERTFAPEEEEEEDPPLLEEAASPCLQQGRPCHCNCFFLRRTRLTLCRRIRFRRKPCNCKFYSFRRTGTHPPR